MAKPKQPVLGLGARGTLADTLTFQRRKGVDIARKKPVPAYTLTLPQRYQRWLYEDYIALWAQQTAAQRQAYRSSGSRLHLTGLQYFLKYHLTHLPDITAWWPLDAHAGAITPDRSRNNYHGTVVGASRADGRIAECLYFDGLNDYVHQPALMPDVGTLELWLDPINAAGVVSESFFGASTALAFAFDCLNWDVGNTYWGWIRPGLDSRITTPAAFPTGFFIVHLQWSKTTGVTQLYWNNALIGQTFTLDSSIVVPLPPFIGAYNFGGAPLFYSNSSFDNIIVYNRLLDDADRQRHLERRWPQ
ncbi:hypothetical protein ES703_84404 [subsurface metagenome]